MERKIGEIFEYNGEWYQCVQGNCEVCDFSHAEHTCLLGVSNCVKFRKNNDCKAVAFKKLEKVGEPYVGNNGTFQSYKLAMPIYGDIPDQITGFTTTEVVIKQNKEDMEGNKTNFVEELDSLCKRYNMSEGVRADFMAEVKEIIKDENRECKLRHFDFEAAKLGKPVCTRDGRKARIICFDAKGSMPIVALISNGDDENLHRYYNSGSNYVDNDYDLMMLPEKKERWMNVYRNKKGEYWFEQVLFSTKKEATDFVHDHAQYVTTVKVEWEE